MTALGGCDEKLPSPVDDIDESSFRIDYSPQISDNIDQVSIINRNQNKTVSAPEESISFEKACEILDKCDMNDLQLPESARYFKKYYFDTVEYYNKMYYSVYFYSEKDDKKVFVGNNTLVSCDGELVLIDMADISRGNALYDIGGAFLTMYLSGMRNPDITLQTIGINYEMAKQVWGIMLSTYYGTTDPQRLELISKRCGAFALLRMAVTLGIGSKRVKESAPGIVALLRQQLFPNADGLCQLFAMPV